MPDPACKPMIGVLPLVDTEKESYWMLPGYMLGIEQAGGLPVMLPLTCDPGDIEQLAESFDGFLYTGGHDVSPELYGAERIDQCAETSAERDEMERQLLETACKLEKPVLGICRGIQFINAAMGGTLYQDLPTQRPTGVEHHQQAPYDVPSHEVTIVEGSPLHELLGVTTLAVNSYHHQAVRDLAPELEAMAYSEDGLVEAIRDPRHAFVWAVQWHPEFSYLVEETSRTIFSRFVEEAAKVRKV